MISNLSYELIYARTDQKNWYTDRLLGPFTPIDKIVRPAEVQNKHWKQEKKVGWYSTWYGSGIYVKSMLVNPVGVILVVILGSTRGGEHIMSIPKAQLKTPAQGVFLQVTERPGWKWKAVFILGISCFEVFSKHPWDLWRDFKMSFGLSKLWDDRLGHRVVHITSDFLYKEFHISVAEALTSQVLK